MYLRNFHCFTINHMLWGRSLESPQRGDSNEYPQHMLLFSSDGHDSYEHPQHVSIENFNIMHI